MKAEEMFKDIGYEIKKHDDYKIIYKTAEDGDKVKVSKITFDLEKNSCLPVSINTMKAGCYHRTM